MENLEIPAGIQGNAVICKDQLALLQFVQSAQHDDGHFGEAKLARGGKPAMACAEHRPLRAPSLFRQYKRISTQDYRDGRKDNSRCKLRDLFYFCGLLLA